MADRLAQELRGAELPVVTARHLELQHPWPVGWRKPGGILRGGPGLWPFFVHALRLSPPPGRPFYRFRRALQLPRFVAPLLKMEKSRPGAIIVLDEWLAHLLSGALLSKVLSDEDARSFLQRYTNRFDATFVFLELDPETAAARVAARSAARPQLPGADRPNFWDGVPEIKVLRAIKGFEEGYRAVTHQLRSIGASVLVVDARRSPSDIAHDVSSVLRSTLRRASEGDR